MSVRDDRLARSNTQPDTGPSAPTSARPGPNRVQTIWYDHSIAFRLTIAQSSGATGAMRFEATS